jgi:hypothetical protein
MPDAEDDQMAAKTNLELYEEIFGGEYTDQTIQAAKFELEKRNLDSVSLQKLRDEFEEEHRKKETMATEPLQWPLKLLSLCLMGLPALLLWVHFRNKGSKRKASECWKWFMYGWVFQFLFWVIRIAFLPTK